MKVSLRGGVYWYDFSIAGQRYRASCFTDDEDKAKRVLAQKYEAAWNEERLGDKPRRTWTEAMERWLSEHRHKRTHDGDVKHGRWWSEKFAQRKAQYLDQITPDLVKLIRDSEVGRPKERGGEPIKPATVNRKIAFLRSVMNAAAREYQWIDTAPLFRFLPGEVERVRFLTPPELQRLLMALEEPYRSMALLAVATGLRQANVVNLTWDQVNFGARTLTFPGLVMKNGQPLTIPMSESAMNAIRPWVGKHEDRVFIGEDGKPVKAVNSKMWRRALNKAGITNFKWHDLRHTWASLMRQSGKDLAVIQELGAWQSEKMVKRYAHLSVDHLAAHVSVMDQVLNPGLVQIRHSA